MWLAEAAGTRRYDRIGGGLASIAGSTSLARRCPAPAPGLNLPLWTKEWRETLYVDKAKVIAELRSRQLYARADWVDRELPG